MFVKNLKRHYVSCLAFSLGIMLSNIIGNLGAADFLRVAVNLFMVVTFAFLLYSVIFGLMSLVRLVRHLSLPKFFSILLILLTLVPMVPAEANQGKKAARQLLRDGLIFVGGVIVANQVDDAIDAVEGWVYDHTVGPIYNAFYDAFIDPTPPPTYTCSYCHVTYTSSHTCIADSSSSYSGTYNIDTNTWENH